MTPVMAVCTLVLLACALVVTVGAYLFGPIFGWVPKQWHKPWTIIDGMDHYQGLKLGKSYNAFQLYPWHVLLLAIVVGIEVVVYYAFGSHQLLVQGEIVGIVALAAGIIIGLLVYLDSDTGRVFNQYLTAKKQKVCPIVEFKNKE